MNDKPVSKSFFRKDINSFRALAVIAVTLYHFGVPGFRGGFVGVDIFFVISGFLMTSIVVCGLESSKGFSIWGFYLSRARRIFPALIVLCAVLLMFGWWCLTWVDYKPLSKQVISSLAFISNIAFWREAGYFDMDSQEKWLLHTWSLSLEWQFYLLLPVLLMIIWRLYPSRTAIKSVLILVFLLSFFLSIYMSPFQATASFYLLHTRAWEMLAGGLVYLYSGKSIFSGRQKNVLEVIGFGIITISILFFDSTMNWPGWRAFIPVVGTVFLLLSDRPSSLFSGNIFVQWLGTRSYSIYLWHWPFVVALVFLGLKDSLVWVCIGIFFTLVAGHFSYSCIEIIFRQQANNFQSVLKTMPLFFTYVITLFLGVFIYFNNGFSGRFSPAIELIAEEKKNVNPRKDSCLNRDKTDSPSCVYGGTHIRAILIGDSHADAVVTALSEAMPIQSKGIIEWAYTSCPTIRSVIPIDGVGVCGGFVEWVINQSETVPKDVPLVLVNRTTYYAVGDNKFGESVNKPRVYFGELHRSVTPESLDEFSKRLIDTACLLAKKHTLYLMRPIPEMGVDVPKTMARDMMLGKQNINISISLDDYHQRHHFIWAAQNIARDSCGVKILDPLPYLCNNGRCYASKDGRPLYFDDNHLSEFGNKLLVPMFKEVFN